MGSSLAPPRSSLLPIARWGWREIVLYGLPLTLAGLLVWHLIHPAAALVPGLGLAFLVNFFRDPTRTAPDDPELMVSPADGRVTTVEEIDADHPHAAGIGEKALRISIFLSVFDVHVNRAPIAGRVTGIRYRPGRFLDARDPRCAQENEANRITLSPHGSPDTPIVVVQVSGAIARRIVCPLHLGQDLDRAARFGMIKFGSRTDLLVPSRLTPRALVQPGDRVRGGATALVRLAGIDTTAGAEERDRRVSAGDPPVSTATPASSRSA